MSMTLPTGRDVSELKKLEARLETGWERVRAAEGTPEGQRLTDFFLTLLRQYETLHDKVHGTRRRAAPGETRRQG